MNEWKQGNIGDNQTRNNGRSQVADKREIKVQRAINQ